MNSLPSTVNSSSSASFCLIKVLWAPGSSKHTARTGPIGLLITTVAVCKKTSENGEETTEPSIALLSFPDSKLTFFVFFATVEVTTFSQSAV